MVFICRKVPNSDMILTCIDSYLVVWKAYFDDGLHVLTLWLGERRPACHVLTYPGLPHWLRSTCLQQALRSREKNKRGRKSGKAPV